MIVRVAAVLIVATVPLTAVAGSGCGDSDESQPASSSAPPALERFPLVATRLTIHERAFTGGIKPREPNCVPDRDVTLVYRAGGVENEAGSDTTDGNGEFGFRLSSAVRQQGVDYSARIAPAKLEQGDRTMLCEGGETAAIKLPRR